MPIPDSRCRWQALALLTAIQPMVVLDAAIVIVVADVGL